MPEIVGRLRTPRLAGAPATPVAGEMYFDTGTSTLFWWDGAAWVAARDAGAVALPLYDETSLPIAAPTGTMAWFSYSAAPGGSVYSAWFSGGVWYMIGQIPIVDTGSLAPAALVAATGWRRAAASVTVPMRGNYMFYVSAEVAYSAAEGVGGIGTAPQGIADTGSPTISVVTHGQSTANYRTPSYAGPTRVALNAGDVVSLRANSSASVTITFTRARVWALPLYLYGVV